MTWELFYLACFVFGLILCAVSLFTGAGHLHLHAGHVHVPHAGASGHSLRGGASGNGPQGRATPPGFTPPAQASPVNAFTITAFLCWFGGVGYLLRTHSLLYGPLVLLVAIVSGLAGAGCIFWFLTSVLLPRERELTAEETEITGVVGRLTSALQANATGEVIYSQLGARRSVPARSEDGSRIDRDAEVVVLRYERGVAYVRPWRDMDL